MVYSHEQRAAYFKKLRDAWADNKKMADQDDDARVKWQAIQAEAPEMRISYYGFTFALYAMRAHGFVGLPYVDAKTYQGWRASGFQVKKGEESKIDGITWITSGTKKQGADAAEEQDSKNDGRVSLYPKRYALFHRSQVAPLMV